MEDIMGKVIIAPGKYVQGAGEMANLGSYVAKLGKKALVVVSPSGRKRNADVIEASFKAADVEILYEDFNGECSRNEIARLVKIVRPFILNSFLYTPGVFFLMLILLFFKISFIHPQRKYR